MTEQQQPTRYDQFMKVGGYLINLITIILGIAAAYFMTIQSLKIELAAKAESAVVQTLDKKLATFEIILREGVLDKEEFYRFASEVEKRLSRIEEHLTSNTGADRAE